MFNLRRTIAIAAIAPIALLAGCGEATIISADGAGTCEGKGDFTIETTQAADASSYTVSYDGPSDVSLVLSQGFYLDHVEELSNGIPIPGDAQGLLWALTEDDGTLYAYRIDTSNAGWTTTGSGANTHHEFSGTYNELIDGQILGAGMASDVSTDTYTPAIVSVVCDDSVTTGFYAESDPALDYIDTIQFQGAAEINPNHLLLEPMIIDSQTPEGNGLTGTAHFPESVADIFGDFTPLIVETVGIGADHPDIPNDTFSELWFQVIVGGANYFTLEFPDGLTADGEFPWALNVDGEAETGNYIVIIPMSGESNGEDEIRVVFMNLYFDAENGIAFLDPIGEPENPDLSGEAELAETGVNVGAVTLLAGTLVAAGIGIAVARRRRTV